MFLRSIPLIVLNHSVGQIAKLWDDIEKVTHHINQFAFKHTKWSTQIRKNLFSKVIDLTIRLVAASIFFHGETHLPCSKNELRSRWLIPILYLELSNNKCLSPLKKMKRECNYKCKYFHNKIRYQHDFLAL